MHEGTVSLVNCQVYSNQARRDGGGLSSGMNSESTALSLVNCQVFSNIGSWGGGVQVGSGTVTIASSSIYGNTATRIVCVQFCGDNGGGVAKLADPPQSFDQRVGLLDGLLLHFRNDGAAGHGRTEPW